MIITFLKSLGSKSKIIVVVIHDLIAVLFSMYGALAIRYESFYPPILYSHDLFFIIPITLLTQYIIFKSFGLYRGIWRFSSIPDLVRIFKASSISVPTLFITIFMVNRLANFPRSSFFIYWALLILSVGGGRLFYRIWHDYTSRKAVPQQNRSRVIIIGAGSGGEQLTREIQKNSNLKMKVVAFLDDDPTKKNKDLLGIPIKGSVDALEKVADTLDVEQVFIAIPSAHPDQIKRIVEICQKTKLKLKTLPRMTDIIRGKIEISHLRAIEPEDLLGRPPVSLDLDSLGKMIRGRRVIVTGAGGSIGSELCNQLALFEPKEIILFELTELFLYELEMKLREKFPHLSIRPIIGDVRDIEKVKRIFQEYRPEIVFHAAAYKHVPLMEVNPTEAIRTNVVGTRNVAVTSSEFNVERFILVSTDKAVNPTNVMGATKRMAEIVCQEVQKSSKTKFALVRFGNVLGSSGSVIPLFKKQIEKGGPITITHPDITRYFMSIPEASQLVIQAGALADGGEIFVLDMGEPVKIVDLAKQMISLAGLKEGVDINLEFVGLRPGEKLFEELFADQESFAKTAHPMVRVAKVRTIDDTFNNRLNILLSSLDQYEKRQSSNELKGIIKDLIPEYTPDLIQK